MKARLAVCLTIGFAVGNTADVQPFKLASQSYSQADFSSVSNLASGAAVPPTFDQLYPCPTEAEFNSYKAHVKFEGQLAYSCSEKQASAFGRIMRFIERSKVRLPDRWSAARDLLQDPMAYLGTHSSKTIIDLSQVLSIARNRERGQIELGGLFFKNDVLSSAIVLLHEARHSDNADPSHTICRWGDISGANGGCDASFSVGPDAGAYAYAVAVDLAWSEFLPGLTKGQREYLLSDAFYLLNARFNEVPDELAVPIEQIYVLDEVGRIYPVNVLTGQLDMPLNFKRVISKVDFSSQNNGIIALGENRIYLGTPGGTIGSFAATDTKNVVMQLREAKTVSGAEGNQGVVKYYYITTANEVLFLETNPKTGERFIQKSIYQPAGGVEFKNLTHGLRQPFALTTDGRAYSFSGPSAVESEFVTEGGWKNLDGGLFSASLYGIDQEGKIKVWNRDANTIVDSIVKIDGPALKFQSSTSFNAALLEGNRISLDFWRGGHQLLQLAHSPKIVDMVVTRRHWFNPEITKLVLEPEHLDDAKAVCGFAKLYNMIWRHEPVGLTTNHRLVEYKPILKRCEALKFPRYNVTNSEIESLSLVGSALSQSRQRLSHPIVAVKHLDGRTETFRPYDFDK